MTRRTIHGTTIVSTAAGRRNRLLAIAADPAVYAVAEAGSRHRKRRRPGRKCGQPDAANLIALVGRSALGSQAAFFEAFAEPGFYPRFATVVYDTSGIRLPDQPVDLYTVISFRDAVAPRRRQLTAEQLEVYGDGLAAMLEEFTRQAVYRVQALGGLPPDPPFNPLQPNPRQLIIADGTMIAPYSHVRIVEIDGRRVALHSSTTADRARAQAVVDVKKSEDGRAYPGIDHVAALVATTAGPAVAGVLRARVESVGAVTLVKHIWGLAPRGARGLVYDGAIDGRPARQLAADCGLYVYSPPSPRAHVAEEVAAARADARVLLAAIGVTRPSVALVDSQARIRLDEDKTGRGSPLQLGKTRLVDSRGHAVYIDSHAYYLGIWSHSVARQDCDHVMYVDHDSLWDTDRVDGTTFKIRRAVCTSSRMQRDADGFRRIDEWLLPCPHGDLRRHLCWKPQALEPGEAATRTEAERALEVLSVVSRADAQGRLILGYRQAIEAYFSQFDLSQPRNRHAAFIDLDHQTLDFLAFALYHNAMALRRSRFGCDDAGETG